MPKAGFFVDISLLRRSAQYRRLYLSMVFSSIGLLVAYVAIPFEVYRITGSTFDVGAVSLVQLLGLLIGSFGGGSLADRHDRRNMLLVLQSLKTLAYSLLGAEALGSHPSLFIIFVLAGFTSMLSGCDNPVRVALLTSVIEKDEIIAANTLWQIAYQVSQILGPAIGGVIIARTGLGATYFVAAGLSVLGFGGVATVSKVKRMTEAPTRRAGILEGLRFLRTMPVLQGAFIVDLNAMVFGMPVALFPALALHHFHGGAATFGLLNAAPAIGALLVASMMGWASSVRRQGLAVLISVSVWGAGIVAFGLSHVLAFGLVFLAIAGGADVISAVFRSSMLQFETPNELRGRLQGVQSAVVTGGPRLGNFEAGTVAQLSHSVEFSVISGGVACIIGVLIQAGVMTSFTKYVPKQLQGDHADAASPTN